VLVDDIISTARTLIETIRHLTQAGFASPVCIGVHAVFAGDAYDGLKNAGAADIITCNTVPHSSNTIDLTQILTAGIRRLLKSNTKPQNSI
jgi:ribose-phosphate pyrophosphokinase